ncbi:MAG: membrane protein insertion efficiency factor YidD [Ignavibacteria bacterium]|nr:membrane protein insertion efficiency factor YidD [Ignavibacteria bacterium]
MLSDIAVRLIRFYKSYISSMFPPSCRFYPTCSEYAIEAIEMHGFVRGIWLSVKRIARCNPYCKCGYDPVPPAVSRNVKKSNKNLTVKLNG